MVQSDKRAWICQSCKCLNNLLLSMDRDYACVNPQCAGKYDASQPIIQSGAKEEDAPSFALPQYRVWVCECGKFNLEDWEKCAMCKKGRPDLILLANVGRLFWTDDKPQGIEFEDSNNNNANQQKQSNPRKNIYN